MVTIMPSPPRKLMTVMARLDSNAKWWHTAEHAGSVQMSKASLGEFFYAVLHRNVQIGEVWPFAPVRGALVLVSVKMTPDVKDEIEAETRFRFVPPPKITLNADRPDDLLDD
jgi:hypothetical protein